jgi:phage I-like protein
MPRLAIAVCVTEITAGNDLQLFPAGDFSARDGRPGEQPWRMNAAIAARVIAQVAARQTPLVIDYEHQSLNTEQNGQPAPAAGWFRALEWREGQGLYAVGVEWTLRAQMMIKAGEYKYISPVFGYDTDTHEVTQLHSAGLTNTPALDGMDEVLLRAAKSLITTGDDPMKELLKALGLAEDANEAQALAALKALQDQVADDGKAIAALKAQAPDPAQYAPVGVLQSTQAELAALKSQALARDIADLIAPALADGRLLPAQKEWAEGLGQSNLAALRAYLATAQPIAALRGTQTGGQAPDGQSNGLTDDQLTACRIGGWDHKTFRSN